MVQGTDLVTVQVTGRVMVQEMVQVMALEMVQVTGQARGRERDWEKVQARGQVTD